jgi:hypothetical protein
MHNPVKYFYRLYEDVKDINKGFCAVITKGIAGKDFSFNKN